MLIGRRLKLVGIFFFLLLIGLQLTPLSIGSSPNTTGNLVRNDFTLNGLFVRIEYPSSYNSSTPIVLIVPGLGGSVDYTATLQADITRQGYSTVSFTEPKNNNSTQFVLSEKENLSNLLNWLSNETANVGNATNILLLGQSAGGGCVLSFGNDTRINSILAVVPAYFGLPAAENAVPVGIIVGDSDFQYKNDGVVYYANLAPPKWYCNIRNGSHYLGITDRVETLPTTFTPLVEKYIFAWLNYWGKGDENALQLLTLDSLNDQNLLEVEFQGVNSQTLPTPTATPTIKPPVDKVPSNDYLLVAGIATVLLAAAVTIYLSKKGKLTVKKIVYFDVNYRFSALTSL